MVVQIAQMQFLVICMVFNSNIYHFYAPRKISVEHIVAGLSVRRSISWYVRPKFVSGL